MADGFDFFGGIDFSGAREPLANLWSAVGVEEQGRLLVVDVRPHAFRADLATYVAGAWRHGPPPREGRILWGADFPFGLPASLGSAIGAGESWGKVAAWVADRPPDEIRAAAGDATRTPRSTDSGGALAPLDLRLFKQTVEGIRWLHELREENEVSIRPMAAAPAAETTLIEVYPSSTVQELGLPRRRAPARPAESRARAAALRTYLTFADPVCEALAVTLEDAWDATIACLTAYLCRDDLDQPLRAGSAPRARLELEGWIYRPPAALG
jgi:hypothetical protein